MRKRRPVRKSAVSLRAGKKTRLQHSPSQNSRSVLLSSRKSRRVDGQKMNYWAWLIFALMLILLGCVYWFLAPWMLFRQMNVKNIVYLDQTKTTEGIFVHLTKDPQSGSIITFALDENVDLTQSEMTQVFGVVIDEVILLANLPKPSSNYYLSAQLFKLALERKDHSSLDLLRLHYHLLQDLEISDKKHSQLEDVFFQAQVIDAELATMCPIAVVNTTGIQGLAGRISQILEDSGAVVVRSTHSDIEVPETIIMYEDEDSPTCLEVAERMSRLFPQPPLLVVAKSSETSQYRAKLVILLGDDWRETEL